MAESTSSTSSSPCASIASFDDIPVKNNTIKFLCSYGGRILPRYPDGELRYVGGQTRVLSADRSVTFSDLVTKMRELCGWDAEVGLRCRMPTEDLDALVSVTCDDDLANLIEEYDLAASHHKIRAFLHPSKEKTAVVSSYSSRPVAPMRGCVHRWSPPRYSVGRGGYGNRRNEYTCQHQYHQYPVNHGAAGR